MNLILVTVYEAGEVGLAVTYDLLKERPIESRVSHRKMPAIAKHRAFVASRPFRFWYLVDVSAQYVGALQCTDRNEIGIDILKKYQHKGYGSQAIKLFLSTHQPLLSIPAIRNAHWLANIAVNNEPSKRFFVKLGFKPLQETYVL